MVCFILVVQVTIHIQEGTSKYHEWDSRVPYCIQFRETGGSKL